MSFAAAPVADDVRQQLAWRQQLDEYGGAAMRAMTGEAGLHLRNALPYLHHGPLPLRAPHLRPDPDDLGLPALRGIADAIALRHRYSDDVLYQQQAPADPIERSVFGLLEQLRVESLTPPEWPGAAANLVHRFEQWSLAYMRSGLADSAAGLLIFTLAQMTWARLNARPVLEASEGLIESTHFALATPLGPSMAGMRLTRTDQAAFAPHARTVAAQIGGMLRAAGMTAAGHQHSDDDPGARGRFALIIDDPNDGGDDTASATAHVQPALPTDPQANRARYRVYTRRYDRETPAHELVRAALLQTYRRQLDARLADQGINVPRLARLLRQLLATPHRDGWTFGEESGRLDGRRLAQLVSSPGEHRIFRQDRIRPRADCAVTFLLDCSGSMKAHAEPLAMLLENLSRALDMAGVETEILGYTTGAWRGGRPWKDWQRAGRPPHPGRLNERSHLIFKERHQRWRHARLSLAALLKADLFREGADGEALEWACTRLGTSAAHRRIVVALSDGCPMDAATAQANGTHYLDRHLREVIARLDAQGDIELVGLGIGPDARGYYRRALALSPSQAPNQADYEDIARLMAGRAGPRR